MEYPKINSLWKREGWYFNEKDKLGIQRSGRQSLIPGDYADPAFAAIKRWRVDEKIDGTNIRIFFNQTEDGVDDRVIFGGRTDAAQLPTHLLVFLQDRKSTRLNSSH